MKGDLTLQILNAITEGVWAAAKDLAEDLLLYSAAGQGSMRAKFAIKRKREKQYYAELDRRRLMKTISKLKQEGAVTLSDQNLLVLTDKGVSKRDKLRMSLALKLSKGGYPRDRVDGKKFIIVFFDIREQERALRDWLRSCLKNLGYFKLQQSVMVGKIKIPMAFIEELDQRHILHRVHIFVVSESFGGTFENDVVVKMLDQISK